MFYELGEIEQKRLLPVLIEELAANEEGVTILRGGVPVAKLISYPMRGKPRIGAAKGKMQCPSDIDFCNEEAAALLERVEK